LSGCGGSVKRLSPERPGTARRAETRHDRDRNRTSEASPCIWFCMILFSGYRQCGRRLGVRDALRDPHFFFMCQ
jgi:hypothetical protein